jgi:hypothetical protein
VATFRAIPGLRFQAVPPEVEDAPVRTDVLGIALRTRRGPIGERTLVEGWREAERLFGGLDPYSDATYALRGYFENGGERAHVVRLAGPGTRTATRVWAVGDVAGRGGFTSTAYVVEASSPGAWAEHCRVSGRFALIGGRGRLTLTVECPGEPLEVLADLDPAELEAQVAARSRVIRVRGNGVAPDPAAPGPRHAVFELELEQGADDPPTQEEYAAALQYLEDEDEVALLALPGLREDLPAQATDLLADTIVRANASLMRLVLVDDARLPSLRLLGPPVGEAASYLPRVRVVDPFAPAGQLRTIPTSGHVAGLIARLDREKGAHHTPAGPALTGVYDLDYEPDQEQRATLLASGANLLLCHPGSGVVVWGGRTLADGGAHPTRTHVAHRRFLHRLVRVMRRVAEPLVFESNGPQTWLALVRSLTTVLREAWRAGALQGTRPEEAFRVVCDESTQTQDDIDNGRCVCEVSVALAAPMEHIVLRVALRRDGTLEVA